MSNSVSPRGRGGRGRSAERKTAHGKGGSCEGFTLYTRHGERKYLNAAERSRALAAMAELDEPRALFARTLAWTGARLSEVLALTPASFQLDPGVVSLITLKRRRFVVREVPIPPDLVRMLDDRFGLVTAQRDARRGGSRLWPWSRTTGWRIIKTVMGLAGITGRQSCPKAFRHAFGIGALQSGVPLNLIQRWLGHARISTTAIYASACGPEERAFAALFWHAGLISPLSMKPHAAPPA